MTAKEVTFVTGLEFESFTLHELTIDSAANVLLKLSNDLNRTVAEKISGLVGRVPLALQVIGPLLKEAEFDIDSMIAHLEADPVPYLSPDTLPSTERVMTTLHISYRYLSPEHQRCGRLLAYFPGSIIIEF